MDQTPPITDALPADVESNDVAESSLPENAIPWASLWIIMLALSAVASAAVFASRGQGIFLLVLCFTVCLMAGVLDAAANRVPNELTYAAILLGLAFNTFGFVLHLTGRDAPGLFLGAVGPREAMLGAAAFGGIGIICMALAGMGGGDMKLLAAVGAILGFHSGGTLLIYALVVGVIYSLINLAIIGRLNKALQAVAIDLFAVVFFRHSLAEPTTTVKDIPLAVPIVLALPLMRLIPPQTAENWLRGVLS